MNYDIGNLSFNTLFIKKNKQGYSLIELMVTLLIGMIILNGVFQVVIASKRSYLDHKEVSYIQENARFALDTLSRDIRMAGYIGCANNNTEQVNIITGDMMSFIGTAGIAGFDDTSGTGSFPVGYRNLALANTDSLLIRRGESEDEFLVRNQNPTTKNITLWDNHNFEVNQPIAIVDGSCSFSAVFTASTISGPNSVSHGISANNCNDIIRGRYTCSQCSGTNCPRALPTASYQAGARIMPLISHAYFIGDSSLLPGTPALKRQAMIAHNGALTMRTEELATGVENIQFIYGVDTSGNGVINEYRSANNMDINNDGFTDSDDWESVYTVKINMLLRSKSPVFADPQNIQFNGRAYLGLFMRQVVSTTIQIRNQNT